tara:strand:+ start:3518 stop:3949 length:432 start_codon:yes stop_codon:yes gene_type:complete
MPQGGSFPNIPDTPIGGDELVLLKSIPSRNGGVSDWSCSKIVATAGTASFNYIYSAGTPAVIVDVGAAIGDSLDMIVEPSRVTSITGVMFLCNKCDCDEPMTGTTAYDKTGYAYILTGGTAKAEYNANTAFAPTIIGGSGLNN